MQPEAPAAPEPAETRRRSRGPVFLGLSVLLCVASWLLFAAQPDSLAWLMVFPRWTWLGCGVVLLWIGHAKSRWTWSLVIAILWCLYAPCNIEESRSLWRSVQGSHASTPEQAADIRVITFNCASGVASVEEAFQQEPDLILLQESPSEVAVRAAAAKRWGPEASVVWSPDASIVARGRVTLRERSPRGVWVWATWHREDGDVEVVSLRLSPVPLRLDFWSLDCWREMTQLRETHRGELAEALAALGPIRDGRRVLVGGDFNAPAHDPSLDQLAKSFCDAFDRAGVGWGNTIVNQYPMHRIDQIWISPALDATRLRAVASGYSDHRMVVGDLRAR
jgi:vancomycin resistance protein VanJ